MDFYACVYSSHLKKSLSPSLHQLILQQLIKAILHIHSRGVLHRDIKPENILIETGSDMPGVRIIDFGCGCFLHNGMYQQFSGELPIHTSSVRTTLTSEVKAFFVSFLYIYRNVSVICMVCFRHSPLHSSRVVFAWVIQGRTNDRVAGGGACVPYARWETSIFYKEGHNQQRAMLWEWTIAR